MGISISGVVQAPRKPEFYQARPNTGLLGRVAGLLKLSKAGQIEENNPALLRQVNGASADLNDFICFRNALQTFSDASLKIYERRKSAITILFFPFSIISSARAPLAKFAMDVWDNLGTLGDIDLANHPRIFPMLASVFFTAGLSILHFVGTGAYKRNLDDATTAYHELRDALVDIYQKIEFVPSYLKEVDSVAFNALKNALKSHKPVASQEISPYPGIVDEMPAGLRDFLGFSRALSALHENKFELVTKKVRGVVCTSLAVLTALVTRDIFSVLASSWAENFENLGYEDVLNNASTFVLGFLILAGFTFGATAIYKMKGLKAGLAAAEAKYQESYDGMAGRFMGRADRIPLYYYWIDEHAADQLEARFKLTA